MAFRGDDGEERIRMFLSIPLATETLYIKAKQATFLSICILLLCLCSLVTGMLGQRYCYSLAANLTPLAFPLIIYESLQQKQWGLDLLRSQCLLIGVYGLTLLILDAIILAYTATEYRYCYGTWTSQCESYTGPGHFDIICSDAQSSSETSHLYITCSKEFILILQLVGILLNLLHTLCVLPYLCVCHGLAAALKGAGWETGTITVDFAARWTADIPSKAMVILGNREEEGEDSVLEATPVPMKENSSLDESRDECTPVCKVTARP